MFEDDREPDLNSQKSDFLERLTQLFGEQIKSIILAVDLLESSNVNWTKSEDKYLNFIKKAALAMLKLIKETPKLSERGQAELEQNINRYGLDWWVKITTLHPNVTCYFGPYLSAQEAEGAKPGYVEALEQKGNCIVSVQIQQQQPSYFTKIECDRAQNLDSKRYRPLNPDLN